MSTAAGNIFAIELREILDHGLRGAVEEPPELISPKYHPGGFRRKRYMVLPWTFTSRKDLARWFSVNGIPCLALNQILVLRNGGIDVSPGWLCGL